ncbi:hypothetical protein WJX84_003440 [Apatococcus fuscideae]|uniref:Uncharacterized protein n=1 Tax=Apatococcus fuscideae TaxID=2026836 RepID=A0AAW1SRM3_9CHLO
MRASGCSNAAIKILHEVVRGYYCPFDQQNLQNIRIPASLQKTARQVETTGSLIQSGFTALSPVISLVANSGKQPGQSVDEASPVSPAKHNVLSCSDRPAADLPSPRKHKKSKKNKKAKVAIQKPEEDDDFALLEQAIAQNQQQQIAKPAAPPTAHLPSPAAKRNISMHETYGSSDPSPAENQHGPGMDRAAFATQGLRLFDSIRAAFHMVADSRPSPFIDAGLRGFTPKDAAEALQLLEHAHSLVTRGAHPGSDYGAVEQYLDPQVNPQCPFWAHMNLYGHIERLMQELKHARKQDKSLRGKGEAPGIAAGHSTISHIKVVEMQRGLKPMRRNINIVSALVDLARIATLDAEIAPAAILQIAQIHAAQSCHDESSAAPA